MLLLFSSLTVGMLSGSPAHPIYDCMTIYNHVNDHSYGYVSVHRRID